MHASYVILGTLEIPVSLLHGMRDPIGRPLHHPIEVARDIQIHPNGALRQLKFSPTLHLSGELFDRKLTLPLMESLWLGFENDHQVRLRE
jgi:hypothetical protein